MTQTCSGLRLVEKLADGEASAAERRKAEAHLAGCPACRLHLDFLRSVEEASRASAPPDPPEAYWDHLQRRILVRVEGEKAAAAIPFWRRLFTTGLMRWEAVAATLVVLAAVGVVTFREGLLRGPEALPPPRIAQQPSQREAEPVPRVQEETVVSVEPSSPPAPEPSRERAEAPPMARDESAAPDTAFQGARPAAPPGEDLRSLGYVADTANPPEPPPSAGSEREEASDTPRAFEARRSTSALAKSAIEDCESLRRAVAARGNEDASELRYELSICSIRSYEESPSEERRRLAIADAEAFLARESEGPRAEEIRSLLERMPPR